MSVAQTKPKERKRRRPPKLNYYARKCVRGNDEIMVAGWDTETSGLGGELLSIQYGIFGEVKVATGPGMVDEFLDFIMEYTSPVVWFCHNAQYDWRYVMDRMAERGFQIEISMRTANDVYEIRIIREDGKKVILRDSFAIFNSSLKKMAASFCPHLPKGDIDFDAGVIYDPNNPEHVAYGIRDVQILLTGLPKLFDLLKLHFDVNPNATFASTSLKAWQLTIPEGEYYNTIPFDEKELYIRQAYYGGLVFLTDTNIHKNAKTYDLNSSYPAAMMKYGVPYGRMMATRDYEDEKMGIYRVRVKTPEDLIVPILPARDKKGNMRWFRGEFETVVTNRELIFAANHGYEILEVYEGVCWEETIFPFNEHIEHCKAIRFGFPPIDGVMSPEEYLAKVMQNSLYGKFGSRRERRRMLHAASCQGDELLGAEPWGDDGFWYVKSEIDEDMRCMPHWAVFITAHARLRLLQSVYEIGPQNVLYGDTDSITVKGDAGENLDVGLEYGQWKLEKEWRQFRAIAPKVYAGILRGKRKEQVFEGDDEDSGPLKYSGAAKGLPRKNLTEKHWKELLEDGKSQAEALSLPSLRVALKNGTKPATLLLRKSSTLENSSNFERLPDGRVRNKIAA